MMAAAEETQSQTIKELLAVVAKESHDPDTQTACVITDRDGIIIAAESNRLPDGIQATPERVSRPSKYSWIQHAEDRAVMSLIGSTDCDGGTLWLNWFPCVPCSRKIVQAGISRLVADKDMYLLRKDDPRYEFSIAMEMLQEKGVQIEWL